MAVARNLMPVARDFMAVARNFMAVARNRGRLGSASGAKDSNLRAPPASIGALVFGRQCLKRKAVRPDPLTLASLAVLSSEVRNVRFA